MNADSATVFVIDDDEEVRRSLERLVRSAGWAVETFASAHAFLERSPHAGAGCVVLDVQMPGMTGPGLQTQLARRQDILPIVYLSGHGDVPTSVFAMKNGAVDFLEKPVEDEVLLQSISRALARHAAQQVQRLQRQVSETKVARLSTREREVMECVIEGRLNKQIAADLGISEKTVKAHRARVMEKVEARSVAALVRLCDCAGVQPRRALQSVRNRIHGS
jgi:FixJ family two-component response regulator